MNKSDQVEAMLTLVQTRLATPIEDPEELNKLRKGLEAVADRISTIRQYPLENADEPKTIFSAYRTDWE